MTSKRLFISTTVFLIIYGIFINNFKSSTVIQTPNTISSMPRGPYKDGLWDGKLYFAYDDNLSVRTTIVNGNISNITITKQPSGNPTTIKKNEDALPKLVANAIAVQSADVDIITGASFTSSAFKKSLADTLFAN